MKSIANIDNIRITIKTPFMRLCSENNNITNNIKNIKCLPIQCLIFKYVLSTCQVLGTKDMAAA